MIKQYSNYQAIPEKYRFDLEAILLNKPFAYWHEQYFQLLAQMVAIKDSKYESSANYLAYIKLHEAFSLVANKVDNYLQNKLATNIIDPEINSLIQAHDAKLHEVNLLLGSETNRFYLHAEKIRTWLELLEFAPYKRNLSFQLSQIDHKLPDEIEEYIVKTAQGEISVEPLFTTIVDSEIDYGHGVDAHHKKHPINEASYFALMHSKDEHLRKSVFQTYHQALTKHQQSLALMLIGHFRQVSANALVRKYPSSVAMHLFGDQVPLTLLTTLYENVAKMSVLVWKYQKAHAQFFQVVYQKKLQVWDQYIPLVKTQNKYTIEQAQALVLAALKPMGETYCSVVEKAFQERWIDYCAAENKMSGGYSISNTYGLDKYYILLNWDGQYDSVSALSHELGHSLHSYWTNQNQPIVHSEYPILLAEVAAIFNELLLTDHLLKAAKTPKAKFAILERLIDNFIQTVYQQTIFSQYEYQLYQAVDNNQPLNGFSDLQALYLAVIKNYYHPTKLAKIRKNPTKYAHIFKNSYIIPHYYDEFYLYKYPIGYLAALSFFHQYQNDPKKTLDQYFAHFLSVGDLDWPMNTLKNAGVDLTDSQIYLAAYEQLAQWVKMYEKLGRKIFTKS